MDNYRHTPCACVNCGKVVDAATGVNKDYERAPKDGDVAICIYCSHIMVYDNGKVRNPEGQEIIDIAADPDILRAINVIGEYNRRSRT